MELAVQIAENSANQPLADLFDRLDQLLSNELQEAPRQQKETSSNVKRLVELAANNQSEPTLARQLSASILSDIGPMSESSPMALTFAQKIDWLVSHLM